MSITKVTSWHGQDEFGPHLELIGDSRRFRGLDKVAGVDRFTPVTQGFIEDKLPAIIKPGNTYVLDTALGAGEAYSSNINADWFGEEMLREKVSTFVSHAHPYEHHENKDPRKAKGKILFAVYNDRMRRVELVVEVSRERGQSIVEAIDRGEYPRTSMGFRAAWDQCSICGNVAKARSQYCDHLKLEPNKIYHDGRKVCAINVEGHFFDHSYVMVPADRTAGTMVILKVASDQRQDAILAEDVLSADVAEACGAQAPEFRQAVFPKIAEPEVEDVIEILDTKVFPKIASCRPELDANGLRVAEGMIGPGTPAFFGELKKLAMQSVVLTPREFQYLLLKRSSDAPMKKLADDLLAKGEVFDAGLAVSSNAEWPLTSGEDGVDKLASALGPQISLTPSAILSRSVEGYSRDRGPCRQISMEKLSHELAAAYRGYVAGATKLMAPGIGRLFARYGSIPKLAGADREALRRDLLAAPEFCDTVRASDEAVRAGSSWVGMLEKRAAESPAQSSAMIEALELDTIHGLIVESAVRDAV